MNTINKKCSDNELYRTDKHPKNMSESLTRCDRDDKHSSVSRDINIQHSNFDFQKQSLFSIRKISDPINNTSLTMNNRNKPNIAQKAYVTHLPSIENSKNQEKIPILEWWDEKIAVNELNTKNCFMRIREECITHFIEHPVPTEPPTDTLKPQLLILTPKELKKIRKQHRTQKEKEKLEAIRQGLIEPPKPKVKLSNLMRALGANSAVCPSKIENEVRRKLIEKQNAHNNRNLVDKLTPLELKAKKERKLFDHGSLTYVALYRISNFEHPQNRYKVDINAFENRLSGVCLQTNKSSIVIVEGCSKSQARFYKLMTNRINWKLRKVDGVDVCDESGETRCELIWRGTVKAPSFNRFRTYLDLREADARKFLKDHNAEHYWDIALRD